MERCAGEDALQFFRGGHGFVAKGRGYPLGIVAAERVYGKIDAETLFGAINEFLAEVGADVDICEGLAVADNRRHTEYAQQLPPGFNADDLSAGPERLHHGVAAPRHVIPENFRRVNPVERERWLRFECDQWDALHFQRFHGAAKQRRQPIAVAFGDGLAHRRQCRDHRRDRERGAALIIDRGDDTVILQLQLLFERELGERALLPNRKASEDGAGHRNSERNGKNQPRADRPQFKHGDCSASSHWEVRISWHPRRRQRGDHGADRERVVERCEHAVTLQFELLFCSSASWVSAPCCQIEKLPRMAQATATVSEIARISRAPIDCSLNMGMFPILLVGSGRNIPERNEQLERYHSRAARLCDRNA
jgi:hypothetical protein